MRFMAMRGTKDMHNSLPFWLQIRWNLILYSVVLAVVPLALVSAFTVTQNTEQDNDQVFNQLEAVTELKADQIDRWLIETNDVIELIVSDPILYQRLSANFTEDRALSSTLARINDAHPAINAVFLYNPEGQIIAASNPDDLGKIVTRQPYYARSLQQTSGYEVYPPFYAIGTQQLVLYGTYPIVAQNTNTLNILAFELDLSRLGEIMSERTGLSDT